MLSSLLSAGSELVQKAVFTSVTVMFGEDKACASQQGDEGEGAKVKGQIPIAKTCFYELNLNHVISSIQSLSKRK